MTQTCNETVCISCAWDHPENREPKSTLSTSYAISFFKKARKQQKSAGTYAVYSEKMLLSNACARSGVQDFNHALVDRD